MTFESLAVLFQMLGASFVFVLTLMGVLWMVYFFRRNSGIVDIGWAVGFILAVWSYFFLGDGWFFRRLAIALMVSVWGFRLAYYLINRYVRQDEEPRYQDIREAWGPQNTDFKFLLMFLFQGLLVVILSLPFLIISRNDQPFWSYWELWGFILWAIGLIGESLADLQLEAFKKNPDNKGQVLKTGLWRFSRHPNYFFEFIVWVGYFVFALGSPWGILAVISPGLILFLLLGVSGVPLNEAQALKTKGDAYREYQRTTSSFVPWFPS